MKSFFVLLTMIINLCTNGILYSQTFVVTDVDLTQDVISMRTATGHVYQFNGCEDWETGDMCSSIMFNNLSADVTDDVILSTNYVGRIENYKR